MWNIYSCVQLYSSLMRYQVEQLKRYSISTGAHVLSTLYVTVIKLLVLKTSKDVQRN